MKKLLFSALIFCGYYVSAQTTAQRTENIATGVATNATVASGTTTTGNSAAAAVPILTNTNGILTTGANASGTLVTPAKEPQDAGATFLAYSENNSNIVKMRWQSSNEGNIDHFIVEHSSDNVYFEPLHEVISKGNVQGDSYEDADSYPAAQMNYYRLAIISKDSNTFYSPIIAVDMSGKKMPALSPTVLHLGGTLRVEPYYEAPVTINFFNESGQRVAAVMVNSSSFNISTAGWGTGIFFYRISDATHPLIDAGKIMVL